MIKRLLALRTCAADGASRDGFRWPLAVGATVEAPDWDSNPQRDCGGGLHGLPWGHGDGSLLSWASDAKWLVVEVDLAAGVVGSANKCRFRRCTVLYVGDRHGAAECLRVAGAGGAYVGATLTGGDGATLTGGYGATLTGGDGATLTGGYCATLTGGVGAVIIAWWYDRAKSQWRRRVAEVDGERILPGVPYRVDDATGEWVRA